MRKYAKKTIITSRTEHASRNLFWAVAAKMVGVLGPFIIRTLLIYQLGSQYLGLNGLFTSILQVLSLAEMGFAGAITYCMYAPIASNDEKSVAGLLNYFKKIYRIVGAVILLLGIALLPFLDYLVEGDVPSDVSMHLAYLIYLINTVLSYFLFAYKQSLLNAYQRYDVVSKATIISSVFLYVLQTSALLLAPNYYTYALMALFGTIANNAIVAASSHRLFPEYEMLPLKTMTIELKEKRAIRKRVAGLLIGRICTTTRDSCDGIIISAFLGLIMVAKYSNYFLIVSSILAMLETIGPAITAPIGNSIATESKEKNLADMRKFVFIYAFPSSVCTACLLVLLQPFMKLWVGDTLMLPFETVVLLCTYFYVRTMGDIRAVYIDATGIWWEQRWRCVIETVLNLALCVMLVNVMGINGVCLGTLIALFGVNFCYGSHLLFRYFFGLKYAKYYYIDHALYAAVTCAVCFAVYMLVPLLPTYGVLGLIIKGIVSVALSGLLLVFAYCRTKRFGEAKDFMLTNVFRHSRGL